MRPWLTRGVSFLWLLLLPFVRGIRFIGSFFIFFVSFPAASFRSPSLCSFAFVSISVLVFLLLFQVRFWTSLLDFSSNLRSFWSLFALPVLDFMMLFVYSDFPSPGSFFLDLIFFAWSLKPTTVAPSPRTPVTMPGLKDHVGNRTESDERCSGATDPLDTHAAAALQSAVHPGRSSIPTASMMFCFS